MRSKKRTRRGCVAARCAGRGAHTPAGDGGGGRVRGEGAARGRGNGSKDMNLGRVRIIVAHRQIVFGCRRPDDELFRAIALHDEATRRHPERAMIWNDNAIAMPDFLPLLLILPNPSIIILLNLF